MTERSIRVADGRSLGVTEWGDPEGFPVLMFHGNPGRRLWLGDSPSASEDVGARLLAVDRPGFGLSSLRRRMRYLDWPGDVARVADELGLQDFSILGVSTGAAFAAACAVSLGDRVLRMAFIGTPAPLADQRVAAGLTPANRLGMKFAAIAARGILFAVPALRVFLARAVKQPDRFFAKAAPGLAESDIRILDDPEFRALVIDEVGRLDRRAAEAVLREVVLLTEPWGFEPEQVPTPTTLWHGEHDTVAPIVMAEVMRERLPNATLKVVPGAGHLLLRDPSLWRDVLEDLAPRAAPRAHAATDRAPAG